MEIQLKDKIIENNYLLDFFSKEVYLSKKKGATTSVYDWYKRKYDIQDIQIAVLDEGNSVPEIYKLLKFVKQTLKLGDTLPRMRLACLLIDGYDYNIRENWIMQRTNPGTRMRQMEEYGMCLEGWIEHIPLITVKHKI